MAPLRVTSSSRTEPSAHGARWSLGAACTSTFILLVNVTIVIVALPELAADLDASPSSTRWVIAGYALVLASLLLGAGSLADRVGHRRVFLWGLVLFLVGSAASGAAPSISILLAARVVQGAAAAMLFTTSLALIAAAYPADRRAAALGVWAATVGAATTLGPLLGGLLVETLSWRWVFFVGLPAAALAAAIALLRVPESGTSRQTPVDWWGQTLASLGLFGVVYALSEGGAGGWTRAAVGGPLLCGLAFLLAFAAVEARREHPMLDLRLFRRRGLAGAALAGFVLHGCFFGLYVFLTIWLQDVRGYSPLGAGLLLVPTALMSVLLGPLAGQIASRARPWVRVGSGLILVACGSLLLAVTARAPTWGALLPGLILGGAGVGIANPAIAGAALASLEPGRSGLAGAINMTSRQLGTAVGVAGLGTLLDTNLDNGYTGALIDVLLLAALLAVAGGCAAAALLQSAESGRS